MTLLEKVRALCAEQNLTLAKLEKLLSFGNGTIGRWDVATPSGDRLAKVADYFGVTVDYLLGRNAPDLNTDTTLEGAYFRFAREAQDLRLDAEDMSTIMNIYRKHKEKNR